MSSVQIKVTMRIVYLLTLTTVVWSWPSVSDISLKPVIESDVPNVLSDEEFLPKKISPEETRGALSENYTNILTNYLYKGEALLTENQFAAVHPENSSDSISRKKRQAIPGGLWPGGNVYYYLDYSVVQRVRYSISVALEYIQSRTCITFHNTPNSQARIKVSNANPGICQSAIGMTGREQSLLLGPGCEVMGTAAHEFIHALGFWHTQMRYDRDDYVRIDTSRVRQNNVHNFDKTQRGQTINYVPYEYGSVMHYPAHAFDEGGGVSVIPHDRNYLYTIGSHIISFYDIDMINRRYQCNDRCGSSIRCANGGVPNPRNCNVCNCPHGYGGATCQERPPGCGRTLQASNSWQVEEITVRSPFNGESDVYVFCNHWITAPEGTTIEVNIMNIRANCGYACSHNGIEIKTRPDQKVTNPRYCCPKFANTALQSSLNPTPVISYTRLNTPTFTIQYRYVNGRVGPTGPVQPTPQPTSCRNYASDQQCYAVYVNRYCYYEEYAKACMKTCGLCR